MRLLTMVKVLVPITVMLFFPLLPYTSAKRIVIDNIKITEEDECALIQVDFSLPVQYVSYFPYEAGVDLLIRVRPLVIGPRDRDALLSRESPPPPPNEVASLQEVTYEGHIEGGPFLTLFFRSPMVSKVRQGADFRSVVIVVHGPEVSDPCMLDG